MKILVLVYFVTTFNSVLSDIAFRNGFIELSGYIFEGKGQCGFEGFCVSDGSSGLYYIRDSFGFRCNPVGSELAISHLSDGIVTAVDTNNACPINGYINLYHHNADNTWAPSRYLIAASRGNNGSDVDYYCQADNLKSRFIQVDKCTRSFNTWRDISGFSNISSKYLDGCSGQISTVRVQGYASVLVFVCEDDWISYAWSCDASDTYSWCYSKEVCSMWSYMDGDLRVPFNSSCIVTSSGSSSSLTSGHSTTGELLNNNNSTNVINNYLHIDLFSSFNDSSLTAKLLVGLTAMSVFITVMSVTMTICKWSNRQH